MLWKTNPFLKHYKIFNVFGELKKTTFQQKYFYASLDNRSHLKTSKVNAIHLRNYQNELQLHVYHNLYSSKSEIYLHIGTTR